MPNADAIQTLDGQIPLTRNEIAGLFTSLIPKPSHNPAHRLRWSAWRRRHQPEPRHATTSGKQPKAHKDHDLRLEYQ